jgi:hypothetical protein
VRAHLKSLPKAPTTEEATKNAASKGGGSSPGRGGRIVDNVDPPSGSYKSYNEGDIFQVSVPANWHELSGSNAVTFAPEGAYGEHNGQSVFTHGIEIGIARNERHDLQTATDELIDSLRSGNPQISSVSGYRRMTFARQPGLQVSMGNVSDATGENEVIQLVTTQMRDGNIFYAIAVAPRDEVSTYQRAFQRVIDSIRLSN